MRDMAIEILNEMNDSDLIQGGVYGVGALAGGGIAYLILKKRLEAKRKKM